MTRPMWCDFEQARAHLYNARASKYFQHRLDAWIETCKRAAPLSTSNGQTHKVDKRKGPNTIITRKVFWHE